MQATSVSVGRTTAQWRVLTRDLTALFGYSAALAAAAGVIKTPVGVPGHSAVFWVPVLVLAASHRRAGMAVASAALGGFVAHLFGGLHTTEAAAVLAAAGVLEGTRAATGGRSQGLAMLLGGMLAHLGKLGVKILAAVCGGGPLNAAGLALLPTLAFYAAFGLIGGALAWGVWSAWAGLRRYHGHK